MRYRTADQMGRVLQKFGAEMGETSPVLSLVPEMDTEEVKVTDQQNRSFKPNLDIDWINVGLGLLALLLVGGLIPFWVWVYFVYNPPLK